MELTVLGAYGPYPACGGGTSAYVVRGKNGAIALDFGSGALGRLQLVIPLSRLQGVVLSHLHYDHICDLLPFSYYLKAAGKKIPLVYPQTDCVQRSIIEDSDGFERIPLCPQMNIGEFSLSFTKMTHPLESYAVRVRCDSRTLFYSGDTSFCPALEQAARGAHLLLLDCGKAEGKRAPHLSLAEAEELAERLQIPAIATHLNPAAEYKTASRYITVARELQTYSV
ncbi:MAG: MBL fold metallo-hydrolase [Clostridia bacterium]|nr:MBL fold metallo-hydrolase [Clostridia bacterium]